MSYFITGTDTNVGKTIISAWLCQLFDCEYWKPIQSGTIEGSDRENVESLTDVKTHPEAYSLKEPLSPHIAAQLDGVEIDLNTIRAPKSNRLIVEGAGGVMVPLNKNYLMIDLIEELKLPTIIVARSSLGTINHTLLTIQALNARNIPIAGIIINGPANAPTRESLEFYGKKPILAEFPVLDIVTKEALKKVDKRPKIIFNENEEIVF